MLADYDKGWFTCVIFLIAFGGMYVFFDWYYNKWPLQQYEMQRQADSEFEKQKELMRVLGSNLKVDVSGYIIEPKIELN